jgi:hypothetical protein
VDLMRATFESHHCYSNTCGRLTQALVGTGKVCVIAPQTSGPKDWWTPRDWAEEQVLRVAQEVRRLREPRSAQWLADQTKELGHEITRSVIADLENGRRRHITIAELIVLAAALQSAPVALLFPAPLDEEVRVLPKLKMTRFLAAEEFCGNSDFGLASLENMRALQRGRDIEAARGSQRMFLGLLQELRLRPKGLGYDDPDKAAEIIRAELDATTRRIEKLEAERDG